MSVLSHTIASSPLSAHPARVVSRTFQGKKAWDRHTEFQGWLPLSGPPPRKSSGRFCKPTPAWKAGSRVIVDLLWNLRKVP